MLNEDHLRDIETRANAATPGPWFIHYIGCYEIHTNGYDDKPVANIASIPLTDDRPNENTAFISNSRADIPELLSHIREQTAEIDHLTAEIAKYKPYCDAIMWLQEHHGAARHWSRWRIEADDYSQCSDDFLDAFENLKNLVEGETND